MVVRAMVDELFEEAEAARRSSQLETAEALYRQVLTADPRHAGAIFGWGVLCLATGRLPNAAQLLQLAVREAPANAEAHVRLAEAFRALGRWAEAVAHLELALQLRPDDAATHALLGDVLQVSGRPAAAVPRYRAALRLDRALPGARANLAAALLAAGQPGAALLELQTVVRDQPSDAAARNNLGNALLALGRPADAAVEYQAALTIAPSPETYANVGHALMALQRYGEAWGHYQTALQLQPGQAGTLFAAGNAAQALHHQGDAIVCYEAAVQLTPNDAGLHNNMGNALQSLHRYQESRAHFMAALAIDPNHGQAHHNLANTLQSLNLFDEAETEYRRALELDPTNRWAHQGLAVLLLLRGRPEEARPHGKAGFRNGLEPRPYRSKGSAPRILILESAVGGNVRTADWFDDNRFQSTVVTVEFLDPAAPLPKHRLIINAISDADRCPDALRDAEALIGRSGAPHLNAPARVLATARAASACQLGGLPDVVAPRTIAYERGNLTSKDLGRAGFEWPLLVRAPGYHTGEHFLKVDRSQDLAAAVAQLPGDDLLAIEYLDLFGLDGTVRKYRVMMIDGELYPLHAAVSRNWMVHYFSADMASSAEHRAEDEAFLRDMPGVLGPRGMAALGRIRDAAGLDYAGIDFSLDAEGRVVVFEANASMVVPRPDADERWAYRVEPVERIYAAIDRMIAARAGLKPAALS
ncbi:MAG TPA: tetratricopeptide repeat protein [Chloroflexota bacterium]|nr:tetratricopeptide repeat protein [Chloroflexota bacterium]